MEIAEPGAGNGGFLRALPKGADRYEIEKGKDFLQASGHWSLAVGNSPFSRFRDFLPKAMEAADNIVFIALAPAWFVRARQEDMQKVRLRPGYGGTSPVRPGGALRVAHAA